MANGSYVPVLRQGAGMGFGGGDSVSPMARALSAVSEWRREDTERKRAEAAELRVREIMQSAGGDPEALWSAAGDLAREGFFDEAKSLYNIATNMLRAQTNAARLAADTAPEPEESPWGDWRPRSLPGGAVRSERINRETGEIVLGPELGGRPAEPEHPYPERTVIDGRPYHYRLGADGLPEYPPGGEPPARRAPAERSNPEAIARVRSMMGQIDRLQNDPDADSAERGRAMERMADEYERLRDKLTPEDAAIYDAPFGYRGPEPPPLVADPLPPDYTPAPALTGGPGLPAPPPAGVQAAGANLAGWTPAPAAPPINPGSGTLAPLPATQVARGAAFAGTPAGVPMIRPHPQPGPAPLFDPDRWIRR